MVKSGTFNPLTLSSKPGKLCDYYRLCRVSRIGDLIHGGVVDGLVVGGVAGRCSRRLGRVTRVVQSKPNLPEHSRGRRNET